MTPENERTNDWKADLKGFFADIERENESFSRNVERKSKFYADTVRPALDALKEQLALHGRECETGVDGDRVYIIVSKADDSVEFQYAVVAETTVEAIALFAHCWFDEIAPEDEANDEKSDDDDDEKDSSESDDESDNESEGESDEDGKDDKNKKDDQPKRVKTVEPLAGWEQGRELESISPDEIINDFLAHYKEAVKRSRLKMHRAENA